MPTYEYACKFCGHQFEIFQPITAESLKRCPKCKKPGLQRLISGGAGLIFKGTGFYETDYKRSSAPPKDTATSIDKKTTDAKPKPEPAKPAASKTDKT